MGSNEEETTFLGTSLVGKRLGGVQIEAELGRGAMGVVYRGTQVALGRTVAVKVISEAGRADASFIQRFHREARAIAAVTHVNLVGVYDVGEEDGVTFMVQEYIDGQNLGDVVDERGALPPDEAARIFAQAASGLAAAHARGIVHRDVKPDNLMVSADGTTKVTDFGLAKEMDSDIELTATGMIWGSPAYIAPELCNDGAPSPASDLYSLGAAYYQTVTGKVPYEGAPMTVLMKHVQEPIPDPRALVPGLAADHARLVRALMAKEVEDRLQDATVAAEAFRRLAAGESIEDLLPDAAGDGPIVIGRSGGRQWKWATAGVVAAGLLVVGGLLALSGPGEEAPAGADPGAVAAVSASRNRAAPETTRTIPDAAEAPAVELAGGEPGEPQPGSGELGTGGADTGEADSGELGTGEPDTGELGADTTASAALRTGDGTDAAGEDAAGGINLAGPGDIVIAPAPPPVVAGDGAPPPVIVPRAVEGPDAAQTPAPGPDVPMTTTEEPAPAPAPAETRSDPSIVEQIGREVGGKIGEQVGSTDLGKAIGGIFGGVLGGSTSTPGGAPTGTPPAQSAPMTPQQALASARTPDERKKGDEALKAGVSPELVRDILLRTPASTARIQQLQGDARKKAERLAKEVKDSRDGGGKGNGKGRGHGKGKGKKK